MLSKLLTLRELTDVKINYADIKSKSMVKMSGLVYILKLSLISLNRSFNIYRTETRVKFDNGQWLKGEIYYPDTITIDESAQDTAKKLLLKFTPEKHLCFLNYLEKDKIYAAWATVIVDKATTAQFDEIEFAFIDYKQKRLGVSFKLSDIDSRQLHGLGELVPDIGTVSKEKSAS